MIKVHVLRHIRENQWNCRNFTSRGRLFEVPSTWHACSETSLLQRFKVCVHSICTNPSSVFSCRSPVPIFRVHSNSVYFLPFTPRAFSSSNVSIPFQPSPPPLEEGEIIEKWSIENAGESGSACTIRDIIVGGYTLRGERNPRSWWKQGA